MYIKEKHSKFEYQLRHIQAVLYQNLKLTYIGRLLGKFLVVCSLLHVGHYFVICGVLLCYMWGITFCATVLK